MRLRVNDNAAHAHTPIATTSSVCTLWTMSTKLRASVSLTPYSSSIVFTAKCYGPAPLGVGTMTAMLPTMNVTIAHDKPSPEVESKQKNVR